MSDSFSRATRVNPGFKRTPFSLVEIRDILISVIVLSVAFTIILSRNNPHFFGSDVVTNVAYWLGISLALVVASFLMHEFGHKFTAQRYGAWSEFRMFPLGLVACLVTAFAGILFAAPGAVYIRGRIDEKMDGVISAAGPAVNIVLGFAALGAALLIGGTAGEIFRLLSYLNGFLALFNMIPIMPLDGSKIVKWNVIVYVIMLVLSAALLYVNMARLI